MSDASKGPFGDVNQRENGRNNPFNKFPANFPAKFQRFSRRFERLAIKDLSTLLQRPFVRLAVAVKRTGIYRFPAWRHIIHTWNGLSRGNTNSCGYWPRLSINQRERRGDLWRFSCRRFSMFLWLSLTRAWRKRFRGRKS